MNEISVQLKHGPQIMFFSEANDVLLEDEFIQFRYRNIFGKYRTLAMIDSNDVSFVNVKSENSDIIVKQR